jgi:hypothetical protein
MNKPIITILLDSSALRLSACQRRIFLTVIEGWRGKIQYNDVEYGSAFHKFASTIEEQGGNDTAFAPAIRATTEYFENKPMVIKSKKKYLNNLHLVKTCTDWYHGFRSHDDFQILKTDEGHPLVEIQFSIPYRQYEFDNCIVCINICGTIDKVGKFRNGCWAIGDYKTTSSWSVEEYLESYSLSVQLRLYIWAFLQHCKAAPIGSPLHNLTIVNCGSFIDGVFLNGADKTIFKRSRIFYLKEADMLEFEMLLEEEAKRLAEIAQLKVKGLIPNRTGMMNGACETKYGKCEYFAACASPDSVAFQHLLNKSHHRIGYDPSTFGK